MTRDEVIKKWQGMTPMRRNAWIDQAIFGYTILWHDDEQYYDAIELVEDSRPQFIKGKMRGPGRYVESIWQAWEVKDRLRKRFHWYMTLKDIGETTECTYTKIVVSRDEPTDRPTVSYRGVEPSEAICLAALIAVEA